jgi:hypothetical protein
MPVAAPRTTQQDHVCTCNTGLNMSSPIQAQSVCIHKRHSAGYVQTSLQPIHIMRQLGFKINMMYAAVAAKTLAAGV